ncbi:hypothetical protein [Streptomyces winkii]|uniref:hypothetical protein n=1 Tax=Streptomyces winkii TaxID=3051178 RepID=UPI0028D84994|nr:hypothetical protein [Streptomyces sp. DSM 40971]
MSEPNEGAGASPEEPQPEERADDGAGAGGAGAEQPQERDPFEEAGRGPLGGAGGTGGSRAARDARRNWAGAERIYEIRGDSQYYEGNVFLNQQFLGGGAAVVDGPVPAEELRRLRQVYLEAPGYGRMKRLLRSRRLLVLSGEPGSGRTATALALLDEVAGDERVVRLDPQETELRTVPRESIKPGHGHVLELVRTDGQLSDDQEMPTELHLDRLSALLTGADAYGVVIVASGDLSDRLLRGRYGMRCTPPDTDDVLDGHLRALLKDADAAEVSGAAGAPEDGALARACELARSALVRDALALEELRPAEAARLAGHLADRQRGQLTDAQLLDACARFVPAQAREWFAGADAPGAVPAALPALGTAAFRMAVAVFNGSAYSLTAEAAEQLAWEFSLTLDPERAPGRRLFGTHAANRPAAARSVLYDDELDLGTDQVPVRAIRFQGTGLATAVLHEVWHGYHNARGPVSRWLRALCDDPRPQVWVRASLAAGVLCAWDWIHGYDELVAPMAGADSPLQQMAAATALAQASREPSVRPVVKSLLSEWADQRTGRGEHLRTTAILTHGYGLAAGSVSASLDELGKLARRGGTAVLPDVSHSVLRLLAGAGPGTVVGRLGDWLRDGRREYRDLVLLTVVGALRTKTTFLWGLEDAPELEAHGSWPCAATLAATRPQQSQRIADLVRHALTSARSGSAALAGMESWMRQAAGDEEQLRALCDFLPRLVDDVLDADRLRHLLKRLVEDVDEPLDKGAARRMWDAVESEMEQ